MMKLSLTDTPLTLHLADFARVNLTLVGCGGTGSHVASGLVAIAGALGERNVVMDVTFIDPDRVEEKNVGRQLFGPGDVGRPKAGVLAGRLNAAFGTRVGALDRAIDALDTFRTAGALNVVVGAVDNSAARALIAGQVKAADGALWWLDCGNENHSGQVALGNAEAMTGAVALGMVDRLPAPHIIFPDLIKTPRGKRKGKAPSCADLTQAGEQGLMVNRMTASWACGLLYDFLVARQLRYFALAFDLQWGGTRPYTLDTPTLAEACGLKPKDLAPSTKPARRRR